MHKLTSLQCLAAKTALSSQNNKPLTVLAWVNCNWLALKSSRKNVEMAKDYKLVNCSPE